MSIALHLSNTVNKKQLIHSIMEEGLLNKFYKIKGHKGLLHSTITIDKIIDEEFRLDRFPIQTAENKSLESMSSGQQKKALLRYLLSQEPDYLVLDDVYGNVDKATQLLIKQLLTDISSQITLIQLVFRKNDILPGTEVVLTVQDHNQIVKAQSYTEFIQSSGYTESAHPFNIPEGFSGMQCDVNPLVELKNVSVHYGDKNVLDSVSWTIRKGEFWQLVGPNGSGKSTILTLITGDNPRGYGQNMTLFGRKKGSGETIWEIRKHIGYFTPNMMTRFSRDESVLNMIISGFNDSLGLYTYPTDLQTDMAIKWLEMLGPAFKNKSFRSLSVGQQRMVMVVRAMVKHPALLILDEPTIELDEENSKLFIEMVNAIARQNQVAIIYVSHRDEDNLHPGRIFELVPTNNGHTGIVIQ